MSSGADGGAPTGNRNALPHGRPGQTLLKQGANFQNWGEVEVGIEPTVLCGNL
jgi:hypothetical protein